MPLACSDFAAIEQASGMFYEEAVELFF